MARINEFGQPIGIALPDWKPRALPQSVTLIGRTCRLEPLNSAKHTDDLFAAYSLDDGRIWTYMSYGPFESVDKFRQFVEAAIKSSDVYFAIVDLNTNKPVGMIALKGADPINGTVEGGRGVFSPLLKQSMLSTEARFLLMSYVFDQLRYRRYQSHVEDLNKPAFKSVIRLGFTLEGNFRNFCVEKGRSVNESQFSIIDDEWPTIKKALQSWLTPDNFDKQGRQIRKLEDIRHSIERKINGLPSSL